MTGTIESSHTGGSANNRETQIAPQVHPFVEAALNLFQLADTLEVRESALKLALEMDPSTGELPPTQAEEAILEGEKTAQAMTVLAAYHRAFRELMKRKELTEIDRKNLGLINSGILRIVYELLEEQDPEEFEDYLAEYAVIVPRLTRQIEAAKSILRVYATTHTRNAYNLGEPEKEDFQNYELFEEELKKLEKSEDFTFGAKGKVIATLYRLLILDQSGAVQMLSMISRTLTDEAISNKLLSVEDTRVKRAAIRTRVMKNIKSELSSDVTGTES